MNAEIAPCCADRANRVEVERRPAVNKVNPDEKGELVHEKCSICNRNHYILKVEPLHFGVDLK
jgi:hypothetical protein